MILVRWIFLWHLPLAPFDPVWLGVAAVIAAVVLLGVWIALLVVDRRKPSSKL
ncbi:MAG: hypothetical protein WA823_04985 [Candidatus Acidiferrales bacterium]